MANFNPYDNRNKNTGAQSRPAQGQYGRPAQYGNGGGFQQPAVQIAAAKEIPANYADAAEKAIQSAGGNKIKTSKLRNLFGLFSDVYDDVLRSHDDKLSADQQTRLTGARVRMIYECGRERDVKDFITGTELISYVLSIKDDASKLIRFYHYFEALVAYHRYIYGEVK